MEITKRAVAGTMESNDALVSVDPGSGGIEIELNSPVEKQYGEHMRKSIREVLQSLAVENAHILVVDRGALDCTLRARVETAVIRTQEEDAQ